MSVSFNSRYSYEDCSKIAKCLVVLHISLNFEILIDLFQRLLLEEKNDLQHISVY